MSTNSGSTDPSSSQNLLQRVHYTPSAPLPSTSAAATPKTPPGPVLCSQLSDPDPTAERVPSGKAVSPRLSCSPTTAEKPATSESAFAAERSYTNTTPRICMIINNNCFSDPHLRREGSNYDVDELKRLFSDMGFTVLVKYDLTEAKMHEAFQELTRADLDKYSSLVVCIMSHGKRGSVLGTDGKDVYYQDIYNHFTGVLQGRPKLFLVQACRNRTELQRDGPGSFDEDADPDPEPECPQPGEKDIVVAFACTDRASAYRSPTVGSLFIRHFVRTVRKPTGDILSILTDVADAVSRELPKYCKQFPCTYNTLTKRWYLPPCNKRPSSAPASRVFRHAP